MPRAVRNRYCALVGGYKLHSSGVEEGKLVENNTEKKRFDHFMEV